MQLFIKHRRESPLSGTMVGVPSYKHMNTLACLKTYYDQVERIPIPNGDQSKHGEG